METETTVEQDKAQLPNSGFDVVEPLEARLWLQDVPVNRRCINQALAVLRESLLKDGSGLETNLRSFLDDIASSVASLAPGRKRKGSESVTRSDIANEEDIRDFPRDTDTLKLGNTVCEFLAQYPEKFGVREEDVSPTTRSNYDDKLRKICWKYFTIERKISETVSSFLSPEQTFQLFIIFIKLLPTNTAYSIESDLVNNLLKRVVSMAGYLWLPQMKYTPKDANHATVDFVQFVMILVSHFKKLHLDSDFVCQTVDDLYDMAVEGIFKKGHLTKRGHIRKNWNLRFFVLSLHSLCYYETEGTAKLKRCIVLNGNTMLSVVKDSEAGNRPLQFMLKCGHSEVCYSMCAENYLLKQAWLAAIRKVLTIVRLRELPDNLPKTVAAPVFSPISNAHHIPEDEMAQPDTVEDSKTSSLLTPSYDDYQSLSDYHGEVPAGYQTLRLDEMVEDNYEELQPSSLPAPTPQQQQKQKQQEKLKAKPPPTPPDPQLKPQQKGENFKETSSTHELPALLSPDSHLASKNQKSRSQSNVPSGNATGSTQPPEEKPITLQSSVPEQVRQNVFELDALYDIPTNLLTQESVSPFTEGEGPTPDSLTTALGHDNLKKTLSVPASDLPRSLTTSLGHHKLSKALSVPASVLPENIRDMADNQPVVEKKRHSYINIDELSGDSEDEVVPEEPARPGKTMSTGSKSSEQRGESNGDGKDDVSRTTVGSPSRKIHTYLNLDNVAILEDKEATTNPLESNVQREEAVPVTTGT